MTTGGFFERNTYRVTVLGRLKKKEDEHGILSDLRPFLVCHFEIDALLLLHADWGRLYKLLDALLDASICSLAMISP